MAPCLVYLLFVTTLVSKVRSEETPSSTDPSYYYKLCAPSTCANFSLPYPFNLPTPCHPPTIDTPCPNNQSFHTKSSLSTKSSRVLSMNLTDPFTYIITIAADSLFNCSAHVSEPWNGRDVVSMYSLPSYVSYGTHFNCTAPIPSNSIRGLQNASCLECQGQNTSNICYYSPGYLTVPNCESTRVHTRGSFNASSVKNLRAYLQLGFDLKYDKLVECHGCEATGGRCGANPLSGLFVCFCPSSVHKFNCTDGFMEDISTWGNRRKRGRASKSTKVVAAITASALILAMGILVALAAMFFPRKKCKFGFDNETFRSISPTRYSYSQLQKFTNNFSLKLGEGGFGSVYKGEVQRGRLEVPVAIKILKMSRQTKKQFMNEVGTIGRIHHHNLVSMLGYCVDSDTHALVYEFMENGSLDRYIYKYSDVDERKPKSRRLSSKQIYCIALETARGILYLHQGCSRKILHLDIKPANVLLDSKFSAKVSDFGLAKMVDKDHSHVSLTQGQGTPGYAAPEMWLKTHGPVTEKSDVYSYGMLLLEMVGQRKNYDSGASGSSQEYFPEWLYKKIESDELPLLMPKAHGNDSFEIMGDGENHGEEDEKAIHRMCLVGLWCIQHLFKAALHERGSENVGRTCRYQNTTRSISTKYNKKSFNIFVKILFEIGVFLVSDGCSADFYFFINYLNTLYTV